MREEDGSGAPPRLRVVVADDQAVVRRGIRLLVEAEADLEVVGEAADGVEALELVHRERPDVLLVDVHMPRLDGLATTERVTADPQLAGTAVVVLTTFTDEEYVERALRGGAAGYLLKDTDPELIVRAVRAVAAGGAMIDPAVTRGVIERFRDRPVPTDGRGPGTAPVVASDADAAALAALTGREREVLGLVAHGLSNSEIAAALFISVATARTHVGRILQKTGARDRAQLVVFAYRSGVAEPGRHLQGRR